MLHVRRPMAQMQTKDQPRRGRFKDQGTWYLWLLLIRVAIFL